MLSHPDSALRVSCLTRLAVANGETRACCQGLTQYWRSLSLCPVCFDDATVLASVKAKPSVRGKGRGLDLC